MLNVFYRVFRSLQFFQTVDQLMIRIMPDSAFLIEHHYRFIAIGTCGPFYPGNFRFSSPCKAYPCLTNLLLQPICFLTAIAHRNLIDIMKDKRNFRTVLCNFSIEHRKFIGKLKRINFAVRTLYPLFDKPDCRFPKDRIH